MFGVALLVMSQIIVPVSTASVTNQTTSDCRAAEDYGSVSFDVKFSCTLNVGGQTGCSYTGLLDLDTQSSLSGLYPHLCNKPWPSGPPLVEDVQILLSGVEADTNTQYPHHNFRAGIHLDSYDPATYEAKWTALLEWEDQANIMVDSFDVVIHARLHWSATPDVRFGELLLPCSHPANDGCVASASVNVGSGNVIGGVSFSQVSLAADNATGGMDPTELTSFVEEFLTSSNTYTVRTKCIVGGSGGVSCDNRVIVIYGVSSAFQQYQRTFTASSALSGFPTSNSAFGFAEATGTFANMNCGLRGFTAHESTMLASRYNSLWFGQRSRDCNWSSGNLYSGTTVFGWENNQGPFEIVNIADGVRVP